MAVKENRKVTGIETIEMTSLVSAECTCDVCGTTSLIEGEHEEFVRFGIEKFGPTVEVYAGYGSKYDGLTMEKTFCWPCFMGGVNKPTITRSCDGITSWDEF